MEKWVGCAFSPWIQCWILPGSWLHPGRRQDGVSGTGSPIPAGESWRQQLFVAAVLQSQSIQQDGPISKVLVFLLPSELGAGTAQDGKGMGTAGSVRHRGTDPLPAAAPRALWSSSFPPRHRQISPQPLGAGDACPTAFSFSQVMPSPRRATVSSSPAPSSSLWCTGECQDRSTGPLPHSTTRHRSPTRDILTNGLGN